MPQLLVEPTHRSEPAYTETLGPEVAELCDLAGFPPDPEQQLGLDLIFALDSEGKSAAFEFAAVVARQNLKTGLFKQAALGWLFITQQRLITWSAHEFSTTKEALRDLDELIQGTPALARRHKTTRYANDDPSIELTTGQRIKFKARTKTGGRGLTGNKAILDEAFALTEDHLGALMPTMSAMPDPQLLYGSSAGLASSEMLRRLRDRGRAGTSPRLAYLEWLAEHRPCATSGCGHEPDTEGCALDDRELWRQANPLLGRTRANGTGLTYEYVESERQGLPPGEFARERLGWWDDPGVVEPLFGPGAWEACRVDARPDVPAGALALAVSIDQTRSTIGAAAAADRVVYPKPLQHGPGTAWTVDRCRELQQVHDVPVVVDGRGPASMLIPLLEREGVRLRVVDTSDVCDACAGMADRVRSGTVGHEGYPELDEAVAGAVPRPVGDRWAYGRRTSTTDISPLEAVTLAAWAATAPKQEVDSFVLFS